MMSKKGFRKIVVENQTYNWRFIDIIQIKPVNQQTNTLEIDICYFDVWLYVNDKENRPEDFEPKIITPIFVKESIKNALKLGWKIDDKNKITKIKYKEGVFENLQ